MHLNFSSGWSTLSLRLSSRWGASGGLWAPRAVFFATGGVVWQSQILSPPLKGTLCCLNGSVQFCTLPHKHLFESCVQSEEGREHQDLLPCVQLDGLQHARG